MIMLTDKSPKQEFIVLILIIIQTACDSDFTTDYAFLLDGNLMNPVIRSETRNLDIIPKLNNFRRRYKLPIEESREDFFKVNKESDADDVTTTAQVTHGFSTLKIDGIIENLAKKESEYKLASIIRELQKKLTTVSTTTTKKTQKTTKKTTKKTVKTTKGPKTKFKWNKPKKVPVVTKKRTTTIATKKFFFKAKEVAPSPDPSRRSCGRMSPNQEKLVGKENDVSDVIFFSPKNAKPISKPKPKPKPKPQPKRRMMQWKNKNNKGGKQNNKKRITKKKWVKSTTTTKKLETSTKVTGTTSTSPKWLDSFRRAQREGRVIDPKKPVFQNDTHVLMLRKIPTDKLDDSQMEYPFIVSLHGDNNIARVCIGSLIAPTWVLSAAHCISPPNEVTRVRYGDMSLPEQQSTFSPVVLTVANPSFDESLLINDVCLLKVKQIPIDEKIGKLATVEYKSLMGQPITYAGFGFTAPNRKALEDFRRPLQIVEAEVVSCANEHRLSPMFCISMRHWKKHEMTLLGDAGGPAMHFGKIAGICTGEVYAPIAVYTPVSPYIDWIRYTVMLNEM